MLRSAKKVKLWHQLDMYEAASYFSWYELSNFKIMSIISIDMQIMKPKQGKELFLHLFLKNAIWSSVTGVFQDKFLKMINISDRKLYQYYM